MIPEEIGEINKAVIICKLMDGDKLDRDDLQLILKLLSQNMTHSQFARDVAGCAELPSRITGYRCMGRGVREGTKQVVMEVQTGMAQFDSLLKKQGVKPSERIEKIQSDPRYRDYKEDTIVTYIKRGRRALKMTK